MKSITVLMIIIVLFSCKSNNGKIKTNSNLNNLPIESNFEFKQLDTLRFSDVKFDKKTLQYNMKQVDSIFLKKWTDKFMPRGLVDLKIYYALDYSFQDSNDKYSVISIFTFADDWNRMHLLTLDKENELIDQFELGENFSDLLDQNEDKEVYEDILTYAVRLNNSSYQVNKTKKITIDYSNKEKKDSIISILTIDTIEISDDGKIIRK
jgi:hypothetical protein